MKKNYLYILTAAAVVYVVYIYMKRTKPAILQAIPMFLTGPANYSPQTAAPIKTPDTRTPGKDSYLPSATETETFIQQSLTYERPTPPKEEN